MPFAGFEDFAECVAAQQKRDKGKESARRICGALQAQVEKTAIDSSSVPNSVVVQNRELAAQGLNAMVKKRGMGRGVLDSGFLSVREIIIMRNNRMRMLAIRGFNLVAKAAGLNLKEFRGTTGRGGINNHKHVIDLDDLGNGLTSTNEGHNHRVINFIVQPSPNGHVHPLSRSDLKRVMSKAGFTALREMIG
jgi:hypothetical protein